MDLSKETMAKIKELIIFATIVVILGVNYQKVIGVLGILIGIVSPFLVGSAIAFILNVPMRAIEKHLPMKKHKRPVSLCLTILLILSLLGVVTFVVLPEVGRTLLVIQSSVPEFLNQTQKLAESIFAQNPEMIDYINHIEIDWKEVFQETVAFLTSGAGTVLSSTLSTAFSIASGVVNFGIGFIFAIYILLQKENLSRQIKKLLGAYCPESVYHRITEISHLTEHTFSNFLTGQCMEAVILGTLFFITLSILRLPYALLIGVLIAFTALIPIFGAFIGCVVGAFLMLMNAPMMAVTFVIVFFILQQVEGNLIYPHVVGNSVGLPSIWVLVAVTIGGNAFGIIGMLVFIPLCSVLYTLLRQEVNQRLQKKQKPATKAKK